MKQLFVFLLAIIPIIVSAQRYEQTIYCGSARNIWYGKDGVYQYSIIYLSGSDETKYQLAILFSDEDLHDKGPAQGWVLNEGENFLNNIGSDKYCFNYSYYYEDEDLGEIKDVVFETITIKDDKCYIGSEVPDDESEIKRMVIISLYPGQEQEIKSLMNKAESIFIREKK